MKPILGLPLASDGIARSQRLQNKFESGGGWAHVWCKALEKKFCRYCPLFWLYKYSYSFWWALSWCSVQFGQFLVCCFSSHGASPRSRPFVKVPPVPHGVGTTAHSQTMYCVTIKPEYI